jgi:hypothetical protein
MWLATQHGFFSLVRKGPDEYHLRARERRDIENARELLLGDAKKKESAALEIREWDRADYRFRLVLPRRLALIFVAEVAARIDYSNFKGRIHDTPDQAHKGPAYMRVWSTLYSLQPLDELDELPLGLPYGDREDPWADLGEPDEIDQELQEFGHRQAGAAERGQGWPHK